MTFPEAVDTLAIQMARVSRAIERAEHVTPEERELLTRLLAGVEHVEGLALDMLDEPFWDDLAALNTQMENP